MEEAGVSYDAATFMTVFNVFARSADYDKAVKVLQAAELWVERQLRTEVLQGGDLRGERPLRVEVLWGKRCCKLWTWRRRARRWWSQPSWPQW